MSREGAGGVDWSALRIAIVGGDEREREIARRAALTGAEVRAFGFPWPDGGIDSVRPARSATEALENPIRFRHLRRDIARIKTLLRAKELAE